MNETCLEHSRMTKLIEQVHTCVCGDPENPDDLGLKGELVAVRQATEKTVAAVGDVVTKLDTTRKIVDKHDMVYVWAGRVWGVVLAAIGSVAIGVTINSLSCNDAHGYIGSNNTKGESHGTVTGK